MTLFHFLTICIFFLFVDRLPWMQDPCFGAYSSVTDLLFGFDETILKSAFGVRTHVIYLCLGLYTYYVWYWCNLGCKIWIFVYLASLFFFFFWHHLASQVTLVNKTNRSTILYAILGYAVCKIWICVYLASQVTIV